MITPFSDKPNCTRLHKGTAPGPDDFSRFFNVRKSCTQENRKVLISKLFKTNDKKGNLFLIHPANEFQECTDNVSSAQMELPPRRRFTSLFAMLHKLWSVSTTSKTREINYHVPVCRNNQLCSLWCLHATIPFKHISISFHDHQIVISWDQSHCAAWPAWREETWRDAFPHGWSCQYIGMQDYFSWE